MRYNSRRDQEGVDFGALARSAGSMATAAAAANRTAKRDDFYATGKPDNGLLMAAVGLVGGSLAAAHLLRSGKAGETLEGFAPTLESVAEVGGGLAHAYAALTVMGASMANRKRDGTNQ